MFELTLSQALGMSGKKDGDPIGASKLNKVDKPPLNSQWKKKSFYFANNYIYQKKYIYIIWDYMIEILWQSCQFIMSNCRRKQNFMDCLLFIS